MNSRYTMLDLSSESRACVLSGRAPRLPATDVDEGAPEPARAVPETREKSQREVSLA
jgi:hypothetical protein